MTYSSESPVRIERGTRCLLMKCSRTDFFHAFERQDTATMQVVVEVNSESAEAKIPVPQPQRKCSDRLRDPVKKQTGFVTDVDIMVKGQTFEAHACILTAKSSRLREDLGRIREEKNAASPGEPEPAKVAVQKLHLKYNIDAGLFEAVLTFVYTDKCEIDQVAEPEKLLIVARYFGLERLTMICANRLQKEMTVKNVCCMLILAEAQSIMPLVKSCVEYILANFPRVRMSPKFCWLKDRCPRTWPYIERHGRPRKATLTRVAAGLPSQRMPPCLERRPAAHQRAAPPVVPHEERRRPLDRPSKQVLCDVDMRAAQADERSAPAPAHIRTR